MNSSPALPLILSGLLSQLPILVVTLLGLIVSVARWREAPAASRWTLAALLLSLLVCVGVPVAQGLMMEFIRGSGVPAVRVGLYYSGLGIFWATLRAASIGLLLVAVYAGRGVAAAAAPGTLPPPPGYPPALAR